MGPSVCIFFNSIRFCQGYDLRRPWRRHPRPGTAKTIKGLAKNASGKGARDATDYGETHTKCFYQHHSTAISLACVQGSAMSLVSGLENLERALDHVRTTGLSELMPHCTAISLAPMALPRPKQCVAKAALNTPCRHRAAPLRTAYTIVLERHRVPPRYY